MRLPAPALWMVPVVLAAWGVIQLTEEKPTLDVPAQATAQVVAPLVYKTMPRSVPTRIRINAVWINAPLDQVGLARDGTVETPSYARPKNAAWYKLGPTPGEAGAAVILGHVDTEKETAVFFELRRLKPGAVIEVFREDKSTVKFKVDSVEQFRKSQFPTARVYQSTPNPTLRLVTCGGKFDQKLKDYLDNIVVFATMDSV